MKNLDKINPIKRDELRAILSDPEVVKYFSSIRIFGSAVTDRCTEKSDIDFFVTLKPEYENKKDSNASYIALKLATVSDCDILYAHEQREETNPQLYRAMINGVEVLGD